MNALPLLEKLQSIAKQGLYYTKDIYDRQRYEQLLELTAEYYSHALKMPQAETRENLKKDLGKLGVSPVLGSDAAIFDSSGRILLMKRTDNQKWCLPCGLVEAGESPEQGAVREAREETGLDVQVLELVKVYTRLPNPEYGLYTLVSTVYLCEVTGGVLTRSHEDLGLEYWDIEEVPIWHSNMESHARDAHTIWLKQMSAKLTS
jgi:ADP-ribose pyrophosphatase YjhB (NUDIX family)